MTSAGPAAHLAEVRGWLASLTSAGVDDATRIDLLGELERVKAACAAAQARVVVAFAESQREAVAVGLRDRAAADPRAVPPTARTIERTAARSVAAQVGLCLGVGPSRGARIVATARRLVSGDLPATMTGLTSGVVSEEKAAVIAREVAMLSADPEHTVDAEVVAEVEQRLAALAPSLSPRELDRAARTATASCAPTAVLARMSAAVAKRSVTCRPAPDGMARLSVLGPLAEVAGAYAALSRHADQVLAGGRPDDPPAGRGRSQVMSDTALRWLSGRAPGQGQPVEIQLVMTDRALLDPGEDVGQVLGFGPVPSPVARTLALGSLDEQADRWVRRLFTSPDGRDLLALESRRRFFPGGIRRFLGLRDQATCRTPTCGAPVRHHDHVHPWRAGGATSSTNGVGSCLSCNLTKEAPGWRHEVTLDPQGSTRHTVTVTTPTGHSYTSTSPPILGWGSRGLAVAVSQARAGPEAQ